MSESTKLWDIAPQHTGLRRRLLRRWRMGLLLLLAAGALAALVVPLVLTGHRFEQTLTDKNPLQKLAKDAQPASARVFDSGTRSSGKSGFAYGATSQPPDAVLALVPPGPWQPGPPTPESPDMKLWRNGHLVLSVRADPCQRLKECRPGDTLVYTEVLDVE